MIDINHSAILQMNIQDQIPFPQFDALLLLAARVRGKLDGELKKLPSRLTLTGLQVLNQLAIDAHIKLQSFQAQLAEAIGRTPSSLSITLEALERNGFIVVQRNANTKKNIISLSEKGKKAWRSGLVVREDILSQFFNAIPTSDRKNFFDVVKQTNTSLDQNKSAERQIRYLKSIKKHKTRANAMRKDN